MYYQYFGLSEAPFSIAVNPRYLYMSPRHRDALAHLLYGVGSGGGFILLTGEVGTGKTTINRCLLEQLPDDTDIAIILNPALNAIELLATVCDELGIAYDSHHHTLKTLTDSLHQYLLANHQRGRKTVLLIDEAQHLDFDVLEQIRLLTNLETHSEKLLQIILIGQPELAHMLQQPELRQLNQRITARYNLEALNQNETAAYIRHRLQVAGMAPGREIFPPAIVKKIHRYTRGIPRLINVLCDRILLGAYGRNKTQADASMLRLAAREVLGEPGSSDALPGAIKWAGLSALLALFGWGVWFLWQAQAPTVPSDLPAAAVAPATVQSVTAVPQSRQVSATGVRAVPESIQPAGVDKEWLMPPAAALSQLWQLHSTNPQPQQVCSTQPQAGIACIEGQATTWDELAAFDRPLLLDMITPQRFAAATLLLGINGREAQVVDAGGLQSIDLARLGPHWTGSYKLLWRPPQDYERPLSLGDRSDAVASVAQLFAQLDGQPAPLAQRQFNKALQERVTLFQQRYGLQDDGVVGVQTLLKVNELLGIDPTAAAARGALAIAPAQEPSL
tara:strand:- start:292828 stop:294510 length:1683 start_codon:yes stop_codon:yes gene_type:complete